MAENHSAAVREVLDLMGQLNVSLLDLETYGYVETVAFQQESESLTVPVDEAFNRLVEDGFNYWAEDSNGADHWYQAGLDMVRDALDERDLIPEEQGDIEIFDYVATHVSSIDGSTAMEVVGHNLPDLYLKNEDGFIWKASRDQWEEIAS